MKARIRIRMYVETCDGTIELVRTKRRDGRFRCSSFRNPRGEMKSYWPDELRRVWPTFVGFVAVHQGPLRDLDREVEAVMDDSR